jgi:OOP family OmpA-OmpF porin
MFKQIAVAAALVIASSSALAADAPKFYVGADVTSTEVDDFDGKETGYGAFVGYKFNQNIAVEAGFRRLADYKASYKEDGYDINDKAKFDQTSISVIGTLPLSNGFSLFGRLGYNHIKAKSTYTESVGGVTVYSESGSQSESRVLYGAGLSYDFTPAISGRLEVQKPHGDVTTVAAGVSFSF